MKILESYKEIAKELFGEGNLGENPYAQGKEPKPGDWWKSSEGQDYAMGKDGERQGPFNDAEGAEEYAKGQVDGDDGEDSAGKLSGAGDFERDGGEPEDKPFGGDTGTDADYGGGDFTKSADYDMWSDEDPEDAGEPDFYDPEDYEKLYPDKTKPKDEHGNMSMGNMNIGNMIIEKRALER